MNTQAIQPLDPAAVRLHRIGKGPAVLLLHGLGMDHRQWDAIAPLADAFELISYDLPGHGEAPVPPAPYGIDEVSEQLAAVLRREGIARAHMVGHDFGGLVAQHLAASEPGMVDHLVLCDTTPCFNDDARAKWRQRAALVRQAGVSALLRSEETIWFTTGFLGQTPPPKALTLMRDSFTACPAEGYALACEALAVADLIDLASEIYARTLVLVGERNTLEFREAADWLAQSIAGAKLAQVPHAAHGSVLEQPGWMTQVLRSFLGSSIG